MHFSVYNSHRGTLADCVKKRQKKHNDVSASACVNELIPLHYFRPLVLIKIYREEMTRHLL